MAENAWYEKHKKDVAVALKKAATATKEEAVPCTLVRMKDNSTVLCANVMGPKAAALVKEARAEGGKVLSSGVLFRGPDGPMFEVSEGSVSVKVLFMAAVQATGAPPMNVTIVAAAPPGGEPPAPTPPPTGGDAKAQFTDQLRQVQPRYKEALAANPPNKASLEKGMNAAVTAAKENDFAKGLKLLQAVEAALQHVPKSNGATPPSAPPSPPPPPAPTATAAVEAALAKMVPLVKTAVAAHPDRKAELFDPLKRCQDHLKNGRAAEAKAALFDLNRVLKELSAAIVPPPPPGTDHESETKETESQDEKREEQSTVPPTDGEDAEKAATVGLWVTARDKVITQVQQLQAVLGKESLETGDPDFDLIADQGLAAITKRMQVGLHVALLEFDRASGDGKDAARAKAQKVVNEFKTFLESNPTIELVDENPWSIPVEIRSTLGAALQEIGKTLIA